MSSNSTVSQGLQSCLEPLLPRPNLSMHPLLLSSKPDLSFPCTTQNQTTIPYPENQNNCGAWNFILTIKSNTDSGKCTNTSTDTEQVYVPPLDIPPVSPWLTNRSLELCTESLGSETGTYIDSIMDEFSYPGTTRQITPNKKALELRKRSKHVGVIPPPLSSIRGRHCVHLLQIHREDGRLVIKASRFSSCRKCFKSERGNGRLRLSLMIHDRNQAEKPAAAADSHVSEHNDAGSSKIGGKLGFGSRCNGEDLHQGGTTRLPSFPIYVAMS
ncbi:protein FANTASTIC FOUR 3-like [Andrographis paniculata]|uniref:protein FANTASTIC FOUR 3-like n=1 Tax=Andrographis paniculata TaxID=175694 RepID=UPI0021E8605C|nr:protein FANTASTIC FOUR 3-like [Andrographis paniculata]XP_051120626.1 protein FANTASTIC FOUR 3-like [Andrographis paniculata]